MLYGRFTILAIYYLGNKCLKQIQLTMYQYTALYVVYSMVYDSGAVQ